MPEITPRSPRPAHLAPGFSLIELIIVILIASLLASVIFTNISFKTKKKQKVGIHQLKNTEITRNIGDAELICTDKCRHCAIINGGKQTEVESRLKPLKAYILDDSGNAQELDFGRVKNKKVCLRFHYYANGSTSQMILESDEKFYFLPSFFGEIEVFDGVDDAVERWTKYRKQLDSMGTFF
jgi:prepilin-type N-terminal cleavage/methylation domain-containing protein